MRSLTIIFVLISFYSFGQSYKLSIGDVINEPSAIVELNSQEKAILIPRLNTTERLAIQSPSLGLLLFDTTSESFWYHTSNGNWFEFSTTASGANEKLIDADSDTSVDCEYSTTEDVIGFTRAGQVKMTIEENLIHLKNGVDFRMDGYSYLYNSLFYDASKSAMRVGTGTAGNNNFDIGIQSFACGLNHQGQGENSFCLGSNANASGQNSTVFGNGGTANGNGSTAFGSSCIASQNDSSTWGEGNSANGVNSTSWGKDTQIMADNSTIWGNAGTSNHAFTTSFGNGEVNNIRATAWGSGVANGVNSVAWGIDTKAQSEDEIVCGTYNIDYTPTGTTSDKMFVVGNGNPSVFNGRSNAFEVRKNDQVIHHNSLSLVSSNNEYTTLGLKEETGGNLYGFEFQYNETGDLFHLRSVGFAGNEGNRMTCDQFARTGLGRTPTNNKLEVNGTASKTSSGQWIGNSDKRLKKDIQDLDPEQSLSKVMAMKGAHYFWNDNVSGYKRSKEKQLGFIAQDLQKVWPENVSEDGNGFLQTAYGDYDAVFVGAFKKHQSIIDQLENDAKTITDKHSELINTNEELKSEIKQLEETIQNFEAVLERVEEER